MYFVFIPDSVKWSEFMFWYKTEIAGNGVFMIFVI